MASAEYTHLGFWINWSHGRVLGATVTLTKHDGNLLLAFIAVFVTFVGVQFWTIVSFVAHQIRTRDRPVDALHHQRQIIFRNTGTAGGAAWEFFVLLWNQWKHARHVFWRSLAWMIWALTILAGFAAAGIFSSFVAKSAGTDAIIRGSECGFWVPETSNASFQLEYQQKVLNDTTQSSTYSRDCYGTGEKPLTCVKYVTQQLPYNSSDNEPCPFAADICSDRAPAFMLDTGPLDSHVHFGINAAPKNRLTYRKRTTCSVLNFTNGNGFEKLENVTFGVLETPLPFLRFYLGPIIGTTNYTYTYYQGTPIAGNIGYQLNSVFASPTPGDSAWLPIAELNQTDADISVMFLASNDIAYSKPVDEYDGPLFYAHSELSDGTLTYYEGNSYVAGLGCIDQHQFCNPNSLDAGGKARCTALTSYPIAAAQREGIALNPYQLGASDVLNNALAFGGTYYSVNGRGADALLAQQGVYNFQQGNLPNNQWTLEITGWFTTALARMQFKAVEFGTGPLDLPSDAQVDTPTDVVGKHICNNIKVHDAGDHQNFSVLGLALIFSLGGFIVLVSWTLTFSVSLLQRITHRGEGKRLQWIYDDKMRMQQMAFESRGINVWQDDLDKWPVTLNHEVFPPLGYSAGHKSSPVSSASAASAASAARENGDHSSGPLMSEAAHHFPAEHGNGSN